MTFYRLMLQKRSYYLLVQFGHHLLQLLVSLFQVLLGPLESVQFSLRAVHLLLHAPAQLVTHCRHQRRTDRVLTNGGITTGTWEFIRQAVGSESRTVH